MKNSKPPHYLQWLSLCTFFIFIGRAYDYLFWGSPIRALFWDQNLFTPVVENVFGMSWEAYAANVNVDIYLERLTYFGGIYFIICAIVALLLMRVRKPYLTSFLYVGSSILFCHAILETKDHFYHYGQFFEHAIQVGTPALFAWAAFHERKQAKVLLWAKILIAFTFVAHGLYAIGFYPVPGHFIDMTINILNCTEGQAKTFLIFAGIMDMFVGIGLFIPKVERYALLYAIMWGLATAFARIWSGISIDLLADSLHGFVYQTVYRLPHGLVPLSALLLLSEKNKINRSVKNP